ncbi:MAG: hypothetical protein VW169_02805 [Rhodospirillaceae bacterium]
MDELEWKREDAKLSDPERDEAVTHLIEQVGAVDGILQAQAAADTDYFTLTNDRTLKASEAIAVEEALLAAYRWQYIFSGTEHPQFLKVLGGMITETQAGRIFAAVEGLA